MASSNVIRYSGSSASFASLEGELRQKAERIAWLRRLGPHGRLREYLGGQFDFATCCMWAALFAHEVPLLEGEFEFIARTTPEVCE